eukprot:Gb_38971 [translate_table: standard]
MKCVHQICFIERGVQALLPVSKFERKEEIRIKWVPTTIEDEGIAIKSNFKACAKKDCSFTPQELSLQSNSCSSASGLSRLTYLAHPTPLRHPTIQLTLTLSFAMLVDYLEVGAARPTHEKENEGKSGYSLNGYSVPATNPPLTAIVVVLTGLVGVNSAQTLLDKLGLDDRIAQGMAITSSAYGLGTTTLLAKEPEALLFSAIAYALIGITYSFMICNY